MKKKEKKNAKLHTNVLAFGTHGYFYIMHVLLLLLYVDRMTIVIFISSYINTNHIENLFRSDKIYRAYRIVHLLYIYLYIAHINHRSRGVCRVQLHILFHFINRHSHTTCKSCLIKFNFVFLLLFQIHPNHHIRVAVSPVTVL